MQDLDERARQFLADQLLELCIRISDNSNMLIKDRQLLKLPENPARQVELKAVEMGIAISRMLSEGIVPMKLSIIFPENKTDV